VYPWDASEDDSADIADIFVRGESNFVKARHPNQLCGIIVGPHSIIDKATNNSILNVIENK
jgi:hypothetical protein